MALWDPETEPFDPIPWNSSEVLLESFLNETGNETRNWEYSSTSLNAVGLAIILASFSLATVLGNSLVILAVARERYLHSVTNYFITSLAVADCLVGLVVMPFQAIFETLGKTWIFGEFWCDFWHSLDVLASTSSILHLSVISLDRYWAITDPFSYPSRMTNTRACILIALIWVCSSLISFPAILWWRAVRPDPIKDLTCPFTNDLGYLVFSSIISFYGPLLLMGFTYYKIYKAAVEQTRSLKLGTKLFTDGDVELTLRMHRGGGAGTSGPTSSSAEVFPRSQSNHSRNPQRQNSEDESEIGQISLLNQMSDNGGSGPMLRNNSARVVPKNLKNFSISRKLAKFAKEKKAAKTLGIVMGVFIVCW